MRRVGLVVVESSARRGPLRHDFVDHPRSITQDPGNHKPPRLANQRIREAGLQPKGNAKLRRRSHEDPRLHDPCRQPSQNKSVGRRNETASQGVGHDEDRDVEAGRRSGREGEPAVIVEKSAEEGIEADQQQVGERDLHQPDGELELGRVHTPGGRQHGGQQRCGRNCAENDNPNDGKEGPEEVTNKRQESSARSLRRLRHHRYEGRAHRPFGEDLAQPVRDGNSDSEGRGGGRRTEQRGKEHLSHESGHPRQQRHRGHQRGVCGQGFPIVAPALRSPIVRLGDRHRGAGYQGYRNYTPTRRRARADVVDYSNFREEDESCEASTKQPSSATSDAIPR